jgi:hypothetical protein
MEKRTKMSDLINGREMLKRYQVDLCYGIACKDCSMCTEDGGCRVEEWVDKFPSADRPQEWIPCSARLPSEFNDDERVLATTEVDGLGVILIPTYDVRSWYRKGYITAWMPLPEPWKGADDGSR